MWYDYRIRGISSGHLPLAFSNLLFNPHSNTLLVDSTYLLVCGCSTNVKICLIPNSTYNSFSCLLANCVPLFEIICLGTSKRHTTLFQTKLRTFWVVITATGSVSIHLVKYSIATIRYFTCPAAKGNRPRMSIPYVWKGHRLCIDRSCSNGA